MTTCLDNLVQHLVIVVRQLQQLKKEDSAADKDVAWELLAKIEELFLEVFE